MTNKKSKNKSILPIIMAVFIVLLISYISVDKFILNKEKITDVENMEVAEIDEQSADEGEEINEGQVELKTVESSGKIGDVAGVDVKELQVLSLGEMTEVDDDGGFTVKVYNKGVSHVAALLPDKEFALFDIALKEGDDINLTIQSTAESLVFMTPFLMTSDVDMAQDTMDTIRANKEVEDFAKVIEEILPVTEDMFESEAYRSALAKAIESVLNQLEE